MASCAFLDLVKMGGASIPVRSMVTPTSKQWTLANLLLELNTEHETAGRQGVKRCLAALALAVLLCLPLTACQKQQNLYSTTWFDLFDTVAIVQGRRRPGRVERLRLPPQEDLSRYNELFDIYNHYDDVVNLYDVNAAAAAPVAVDDELYAFLRWCKDTVYPATDGATNIAAGAVLRLWHDARERTLPRPMQRPLRRRWNIST